MEKAKWNPGWELLKGRDHPALTSGSPAVTQCLAPNRHAVTVMGRREREDREGTRRVRKRQGGRRGGKTLGTGTQTSSQRGKSTGKSGRGTAVKATGVTQVRDENKNSGHSKDITKIDLLMDRMESGKREGGIKDAL